VEPTDPPKSAGRRKRWFVVLGLVVAVIAAVIVTIVVALPDDEDDVRAATIEWVHAWADRDANRICHMFDRCDDPTANIAQVVSDEEAAQLRRATVERVEFSDSKGEKRATVYLSADAKPVSGGRPLLLVKRGNRWLIQAS
jgi:hypothetical protein